jgi:hypothetical protein
MKTYGAIIYILNCTKNWTNSQMNGNKLNLNCISYGSLYSYIQIYSKISLYSLNYKILPLYIHGEYKNLSFYIFYKHEVHFHHYKISGISYSETFD